MIACPVIIKIYFEILLFICFVNSVVFSLITVETPVQYCASITEDSNTACETNRDDDYGGNEKKPIKYHQHE